MSTDPQAAPPATDSGPSQDDRNMAMLVHAAGIVPFIGLAVAAALYTTKKEGASAFVQEHIKEALNFDISLTPFDFVALLVLIFVGGIGILLWLPFIVAHMGLGIMGAMAASEGKPYKYVINARLLK